MRFSMRVPDGLFDVNRRRLELRLLGQVEVRGPVVGVPGVEDDRAKPILVAPHRRFRHDDVFGAARHLGFRLDDVDGRHRADLDPGLVVPKGLAGEIERLARDLQRGCGRLHVPVGVLHVAHRRQHRLTKLDVRDLPVHLADDELIAGRIGLEVSEQGLREAERQVAEQRRVRAVVHAVRFAAARVPAHGVVGAPRQYLVRADVGGDVIARQLVGRAGEEAADRARPARGRQRPGQVRRPDGPGLGDGEVLEFGVDALHPKAQVVLKRQADGGLHRQLPDGARRKRLGRRGLRKRGHAPVRPPPPRRQPPGPHGIDIDALPSAPRLKTQHQGRRAPVLRSIDET